MDEILKKYLRAFTRLRIDRAHGIAPHKPILLLSILQTFQNGINTTQQINISPELVALFKSNWSLLVNSTHDCRFALPYYHLTSDKFWTLIPKPGFENILTLPSTMRNFSNLNAAVDHALIHDELLQLMKNRECNSILQQLLLDEYFPGTKNNYRDPTLDQSKHFVAIENKILHESPEKYRQEIKALIHVHEEEEIFLRGSIFKREIPKIYDNTCCISGMRIDATISVSMIDACHIVPFRIGYDDTIKNGIALCPNLHRAFDRGLIAIDHHYNVLVSTSFSEDATNYSIRKFKGKKIQLPKQKDYLPLPENFEWHLTHIYQS